MRVRWIGLALLSGSMGLAMAACGGSDTTGTGGGGGAGTTIPLEDVPAKFASAYCSIFQTCFGDIYGLMTGGQDCATNIQRSFEDGAFQSIKQGVSDGTVIYHADKTQTCLDALVAEGCSALTSRMPTQCQDALEGTVAEGAGCTFNAECKNGDYCKIGTACPGTCTAPGPEGADCTADDDCQSGLLCSKTDKKCYKPGASGDTCDTGHPDCSPGLVCSKEASATTGTCKSFDSYLSANEGDTCNPTAGGPLCKAGLSCIVESIDTSVNPPTASWKCAKTVTSGADCNIGVPEQCPFGEYCDAKLSQGVYQGKCQKLPTDGQPCQTTVSGDKCAVDTVCEVNGTTKTCKAIQRLGGTCTADDQCYSTSCTSGVCAAPSDCP